MRLAAKLGAALACLALAIAMNCQSADSGQHSLKQQLSRDGFSGPLTGRIKFTRIGLLECGERQYRAFYYEWEQSQPLGKAIHAHSRLLFLDDAGRYLGSYSVEDRPIRLTIHSIVFAYTEQMGNRIRCSDIGPGRHVLLDGEPEQFFK
ncbi:MAG TPA: hypothetical protein VJU82_10910 [Acidobacteriaceae bacterium]|nr:hypothetical protein [Acidobacteriaceae bacterium]